MTNGMKSGAGSDPFADDSNEEIDSPENDSDSEDTNERESPSGTASDDENPTESSNSVTGADKESLPYIFQRDGVKEDRKMIQYFLRENTQELERDAKRAVEEDLGTEIYLTDLREALVRVGAKHPDEIADVLREWGYQHEE